MCFWTLAPLNSRAAYVPDGAASPPWSMPPVWDGNGTAPESGPNQANNDYDQLPNWYEDLIGTDKFNPDTDGDGITDSDEITVTATSPLSADTNGNGWTDYEDWTGQSAATADPDSDGADNQAEYNAGANSRNADTDGDGLNDGLELGSSGAFNPIIADTDANGVGDYHQYYGVTPPPGPPTSVPVDSDNDGLHDDQEPAHGTSSADPDSDDDGLNDGVEVTWGSSPTNADSDGDGASDAVENSRSLLPNDPDTDDDGLTDGFELAHNGGATYLSNDADSNDDGTTDYQDYTGQTLPPPPADGDSDGLLDDQEASHGTSASDADSDDDGLNDGLEVSWGSNPTMPDTDADGVSDAAEYQLNLQPGNPDTDGDGLNDYYELATSHTKPAVVDTDEDGLSDYHEIVFCNPQTNPLDPDTDHDFLSDFEEVNAADSFVGFNQPLNPTLADSDGDQISDGLEVSAFLLDTDSGGIPDRIERFYGLNPANTADDTGDLDGDSWTNAQEYQAGHSLNADFSGTYDWDIDGMTNVWEIAHGLDPHNHTDAADDPDADWSTNAQEFEAGTNPQVADSASTGTTPDGDPLVRGEGDSQAFADWDQDGTNNLDETLDDETDPTEPDCNCGGDACGCGTNPSCTSQCNAPTCQCGGDACGCGTNPSCTSQCNTPTCGCGGGACSCGTTIACGGTTPSSTCKSCACGGNSCSCSNEGSCNAPCNRNDPCSCGGNAPCGCTSAGQCSVPCNSPCSCQYSNNTSNPTTGPGAGTCSCTDSTSCSGGCYTPPPPCVCSQTSNGNCSCSDASGCSYGSCYSTPDPCGCQWVNYGCTCANENQCSGDCNQPCECPEVGGSCGCYYSGGCDGSPEACKINMPCECTVYQTSGQNCSCQEASQCNNDCYNPFMVTSVEAQDTRGLAGCRSSSSTLKMVGGEDNGSPSASLTATVSGPQPDDEPNWTSSAGNLNASDGDTYATWYGDDTSTIYANATGGGSSVTIEVVSLNKQSVTWDKKTSGVQDIEDKINDWLTRFGKKSTWQFEGGVDVSSERCDYYNDGGRTGYKVAASGSVGANSPAMDIDFVKVPLPLGLSFTPTAEFEPFTVTGSASFTYDETQADPWADPVSGSIKVSSGATAKGKIQLGPDVANANIEGETSISVDGELKFDHEGKSIRAASASVDIGKLTLSWKANIQLWSGTWTFKTGSTDLFDGVNLPVPGLPKTLYTIPD
jgi:Bacterial TSP3 repeat